MDKKTRKGIIVGVWMAIAGLMIAFIVTPVAGRMLAPKAEDILAASFRDGNPFGAFQRMQSLNNTLSIVYFGGLILTLFGILFAIVVWTKWFARGDSDNPPQGNHG